MSKNPKLIGITGGIGSGKSTVCKVLEILGNKIYYADDRAKWLMENHPPLTNKIKTIFGEDSFKNQRLDRSYIAQKAFTNPETLQSLNEAVHPMVAEDLMEWVEHNKSERMLFNEAALLFEVGTYKKMESTILVTAPEDIRLQRVLTRDSHRTASSIKEIMNRQMKDEVKLPLADFVIQNDGKSSLIKQIMHVYSQLI